MESIPSNALLKRFGELLERAARGETFLITRYGRPYVLLSPAPAPPPGGADE